MKLTAKTAFSWAHRGCEIEHFAPGQAIETEDADLIRVSVEEGWAAPAGEAKAAAAAPENKDAAGKRKTKA